MQKKISVACCTYNGGQFLQSQLDSMLIQTRLPDELVICDDGSQDDTLSIIERFKQRSPFPVRLFTGGVEPLGSTKNFERAIDYCSHEIIVLSDQDDVWKSNKLELLSAAFDANTGLVFSDADIVDDNLQSKGFSLFESLAIRNKEFTLIESGQAIEVLMKRNVITGAGMAFLSKFKPLVLPISKHWVHDGWIALLISTQTNIKCLRERLFDYRQHGKNQIGAQKFSMFSSAKTVLKIGRGYYENLFLGYEDAYQVLTDKSIDFKRSHLADSFEWHLAHLKARSGHSYRKKLLFFTLVKELLNGNYHKYSRGFITFARDMLFLL